MTAPDNEGTTLPKGNSKLGDYKVFFRSWLKNPLRTGANAPSSRSLAKAMVSAAKLDDTTKVIELGPGTGIFTAALLEASLKAENLTLIELNPAFRELLSQRYPKVTILDEDAFEYLANLAKNRGDTDHTIVSGLPLLVFPIETRIQMRKDVMKIIGKTGQFVQFTYGRQSPVPLDDTIQAHRSKRVWLNFPPAVVWSFRPTKQPTG